ncbi:MAG: hydroxyacylglutathione hydrolase [Bdellovibrionaceae bacterium]|nr:hydroxyacylglutathione hydrolase [Pseudobdellovibrionaceae bacterium]NUM60067.1 hydroxyacylglutathione hydrolase [Pseudobdellovibrionaceae bacterium]
MNIKQVLGINHKVYLLPILNDNYVFIIVNNKRNCLIVDPGEQSPVLEFLKVNQLVPSAILITHHHFDHIGGLNGLMSIYNVDVIDNKNTHDLGLINELGFDFKVFHSPGHTQDHISFYEQEEKWLFSGDVLFGLGCGRIFDGSFEQLFSSLGDIKKLDDQTKVFCTHEYTARNLLFCQEQSLINDLEANQYKKKEIPTVPLSLKEEKLVNPFLKSETITEFKALRELRNKY